MNGLVGGAAAGTAEHGKHWTTALIPLSCGRGAYATASERAQAARAALIGGRCKEAAVI